MALETFDRLHDAIKVEPLTIYTAAFVAEAPPVDTARPLLLCCLFFMTAFMWLQFLAAWTIQKTTESTRLVQLSGFFQMGPLVFGPLLGKLADGTSKLKVEKVGLFFVLVCSGVIAAAGQKPRRRRECRRHRARGLSGRVRGAPRTRRDRPA